MTQPRGNLPNLWENQNAPTGASTPAGANHITRLDLTEERRAMPSIPYANGADHSNRAPEALCPICALPGEGSANDNGWGVGTASYLCPAGHIWTTRWLIIGGAA